MTARKTISRAGFTLLELSIVLSIIGLIIGGIVVGRGMIVDAGIRATLSQVAKYRAAANDFQAMYGGLPGDLRQSLATKFGFATGTNPNGDGNGDGGLEVCTASVADDGMFAYGCETALFWIQLSQAHMIEGSFTNGLPCISIGTCTTSGLPPDGYMPRAKVNHDNIFITVSTSYASPGNLAPFNNWFGIGTVYDIGTFWGASDPGWLDAQLSPPLPAGLTPTEAFAMDSKADDGDPITGNIVAASQGPALIGRGLSATPIVHMAMTPCANAVGSDYKYNTAPSQASVPSCKMNIAF